MCVHVVIVYINIGFLLPGSGFRSNGTGKGAGGVELRACEKMRCIGLCCVVPVTKYFHKFSWRSFYECLRGEFDDPGKIHFKSTLFH